MGEGLSYEKLSIFPKTHKTYGTAAIVKFHAVPSRGSLLRCFKICLDLTKGLRNDQQLMNLTFPEGKFGFFQSASNLAYKIHELLQFPKEKRSSY